MLTNLLHLFKIFWFILRIPYNNVQFFNRLTKVSQNVLYIPNIDPFEYQLFAPNLTSIFDQIPVTNLIVAPSNPDLLNPLDLSIPVLNTANPLNITLQPYFNSLRDAIDHLDILIIKQYRVYSQSVSVRSPNSALTIR